jgi:hypothetical protein
MSKVFPFFSKKGENVICVSNDAVMTLQVQILSGTYVMYLEEKTTDELYFQISELVRLRTIAVGRFYAFYGFKPLLRGRTLSAYNIQNYGTIKVEFPCLLGGGELILPVYKIVDECERRVLKQVRKSKKGSL